MFRAWITGGGYRVPDPRLCFEGGLGLTTTVDPLTTQVLFRLGDDDRTLREVITEAVLAAGVPVEVLGPVAGCTL